MKPIKRFGDYAVSLTDSTADDEYQREMLHKANTVAMETMLVPTGIAIAILAWALDGPASLLAFVAVLPLVAAQSTGQGWLKHYAPRPRLRNMFTPMAIAYLIFYGIGLVGIVYHLGDGAFSAGLVSGAIGALVTLPIIAPILVRRRRLRDERRLESQLED